jgi:flagellar hook assembly protein FlgD
VATSVAAPHQFALSQNYPNPFNPETEIRYQLPENCQVSLVIYNLLGQQIRTLVENQQPAGFHAVRWDGKDDQGQAVASGVYLYLMKAKQFQQVQKMLLLR